jgi:hypothetical protein
VSDKREAKAAARFERATDRSILKAATPKAWVDAAFFSQLAWSTSSVGNSSIAAFTQPRGVGARRMEAPVARSKRRMRSSRRSSA